MGRDVPEQVMTAALETGDSLIVQQVINSYPPKLTGLPGGGWALWGELITHDDAGGEIITAGVGIAQADGGDGLKEAIWDLLRNAVQCREQAWAAPPSREEPARRRKPPRKPEGLPEVFSPDAQARADLIWGQALAGRTLAELEAEHVKDGQGKLLTLHVADPVTGGRVTLHEVYARAYKQVKQGRHAPG